MLIIPLEGKLKEISITLLITVDHSNNMLRTAFAIFHWGMLLFDMAFGMQMKMNSTEAAHNLPQIIA